MSLTVREADLERERARLSAFLGEQLPAHSARDYFDWIYTRNPDGRARVWCAEDAGGAIVGAAAAFPRRVRLGATDAVAFNLGDFAVRRDHRSLGPALALQRACLAPVIGGETPFAYDHPSTTMLAIYRHLRVGVVGRVVRYVRPLRLEQLQRTLGSARIGRGVSRLVRLALAVRRRPSASASHEVSTLEGRFDARFDELDQRLQESGAVRGVRSAAYLNWRYLDHPTARHEVRTVARQGQLSGYAVSRVDRDAVTLSEVMADSSAALETLLRSVIQAARMTPAARIQLSTLETGPLAARVGRCGFFPRESASFVVVAAPGGPWDGVVTDLSRWYHSDGDRDG